MRASSLIAIASGQGIAERLVPPSAFTFTAMRNGNPPVRKPYSVSPMAHTSAGLAWYALGVSSSADGAALSGSGFSLFATNNDHCDARIKASGGRYAGVPAVS